MKKNPGFWMTLLAATFAASAADERKVDVHPLPKQSPLEFSVAGFAQSGISPLAGPSALFSPSTRFKIVNRRLKFSGQAFFLRNRLDPTSFPIVRVNIDDLRPNNPLRNPNTNRSWTLFGKASYEHDLAVSQGWQVQALGGVRHIMRAHKGLFWIVALQGGVGRAVTNYNTQRLYSTRAVGDVGMLICGYGESKEDAICFNTNALVKGPSALEPMGNDIASDIYYKHVVSDSPNKILHDVTIGLHGAASTLRDPVTGLTEKAQGMGVISLH
jgi:hypothetical protein